MNELGFPTFIIGIDTYNAYYSQGLFKNDLTALPSSRKRTMFQKIVDCVEGIPDDKEKVNFISNNPTRKEIVMWMHSLSREVTT